MIQDRNFKIDVWLSRKAYKQKPSAMDYRTMGWEPKTLTVDNFISHIRAGHSYCHIYYGHRRSKNKFKQSQVVSIDVDDATVDLPGFISTCTLKPTFAYETFSNGVMGQYRYRLVYIIREPLNSKAYVQMYDKICRMTHLDTTKDHCGKLTSQLMNGTSHNAHVYRSNNIYSSITDLPVDATLDSQKEFYKDSLMPVEDPVEDFNDEI